VTFEWDTTVTLRDGTERAVRVRAHVEPYVPARRSGHPDRWSPAEGGAIYLEVFDATGAVDLDELDDGGEALEADGWRRWADAIEDAAIARAEDRADRDRDEWGVRSW